MFSGGSKKNNGKEGVKQYMTYRGTFRTLA